MRIFVAIFAVLVAWLVWVVAGKPDFGLNPLASLRSASEDAASEAAVTRSDERPDSLPTAAPEAEAVVDAPVPPSDADDPLAADGGAGLVETAEAPADAAPEPTDPQADDAPLEPVAIAPAGEDTLEPATIDSGAPTATTAAEAPAVPPASSTEETEAEAPGPAVATDESAPATPATSSDPATAATDEAVAPLDGDAATATATAEPDAPAQPREPTGPDDASAVAAAPESQPDAAPDSPPAPARSADPLDPVDALAALAPDLAAPAPPSAEELAATAANPDADWRRLAADDVNVRGGPGTGFDVLARLDEGALLEVLEARDDWLRVRLPSGTEGWVAAQFVADDAG